MRLIGLGTLGRMSTGGSTMGSFKDGTTPMSSSLLRADLCSQSWGIKAPGQRSENVRTSRAGERDHVSGNTVREFPARVHFIKPRHSFTPTGHGFIQGLNAARLDIVAACC